MKYKSQNTKMTIEEIGDFDEVVYLKTVPPPHKVIYLTMEEVMR